MLALRLLLALVVGPASAQEVPPKLEGEGQILEDDRLVDLDLGFTLTRPAPGWQLLGEERARALLPDLVAGAIGPDGHFGAVIVEVAASDLAGMNRIVMGGLGDALREVISETPITWQDLPAIKSELALDDRGVRLRQSRVVFEWDHHFFQVICNGPPEASENRCGAFLDAFVLDRRPVRPRAETATADVDTRGWRVRAGVFESAQHGVSLAPPEGWRLVVGDELAQLNAEAAVGLTRSRPEAYAYLLPERIGEGALEQLHLQYRASFLETIAPEEPGQTVQARVGEAPVELLMVRRGEPMPFTYWHGDLATGALAWQMVAWTPNNSAAEVAPQIPELLASFRVLPEAERAALQTALASAPTPAEVGPDWSLRRERWTHYGLGLRWAPPPGLWQIGAGDAATDTWEDGLLAVEQLVSGANAVLRPVPDHGSLAKSHAWMVGSIGTPEGAPEKVKVGGRRALSSRLRTEQPVPLVWRITTFEAPNGETYAWVAYALASNGAAAEADLAAVAGGTTRTGLQARAVDPKRFESHRLGVSLDLIEEIPCYNPVPERVQGVADGIACVRGDRGIVLMAVRESSQGVGGEQVMGALVEAMLGQEIGRISRADARRGAGELAGRPSTRLSFGPSGGRMELDLIERDRVVVIYGQMGMTEADRLRWRAAFHLLED